MLSTLTVTNINEVGNGSLRAAIGAASSGDTIVFDPGLPVPSLSLTFELVIDKSLTIDGTFGTGRVAIDGSTLTRIINITGPFKVTLANLGFEEGFSDFPGGAIYNNGGTLTVNDSTLYLNDVNLLGDGGGGIYNKGGTVTINRSTFESNDTHFHYISGGGSGGAIYNSGGTVTINDSKLTANFGYHYGGGIYNSDGTVTLSNTTVSANYAYDGGGGIYNSAQGTVIVKNSSRITENSVGYSSDDDVLNLGRLYLDGTSTIGSLTGNAAIPLDPNVPQLRIQDVSITEGNTGTRTASFSVTLSAASLQTVTVAYATADGTATAGSDYLATSGAVTFAPGETTKSVSVVVKGDRLAETSESFSVNLSHATNAFVADGQGVGTIVDDEPHISVSDVTKAEGRLGQTTLFTFTVSLSSAYDQAVTLSFQTVNGTAKSIDKDYVARAGSLTFNPGETTKTISIAVNGDSKREATEYFYLDLFGNSGNSLFAKNRGVGKILNDD